MRATRFLSLLLGLALIVAAGPALAEPGTTGPLALLQEDPEDPMMGPTDTQEWDTETETEWEPAEGDVSAEVEVEEEGTPEAVEVEEIRYTGQTEPAGPGFALNLGGGVYDFVGDALRAATNTGGGWGARFVVGTRIPVGFEAQYVGSANGLDVLGVDNNAVLLSNGATGLVRVNLLPSQSLNPYIAGGAGWRRFEVTNTDTNTSALVDSDDILEVPAAAGVSYRAGQFLGDLRGAYRFAFSDELVRLGDDDVGQGLDSWDVTLSVGFEF